MGNNRKINQVRVEKCSYQAFREGITNKASIWQYIINVGRVSNELIVGTNNASIMEQFVPFRVIGYDGTYEGLRVNSQGMNSIDYCFDGAGLKIHYAVHPKLKNMLKFFTLISIKPRLFNDFDTKEANRRYVGCPLSKF